MVGGMGETLRASESLLDGYHVSCFCRVSKLVFGRLREVSGCLGRPSRAEFGPSRSPVPST